MPVVSGLKIAFFQLRVHHVHFLLKWCYRDGYTKMIHGNRVHDVNGDIFLRYKYILGLKLRETNLSELCHNKKPCFVISVEVNSEI
jgi:hypothetical protein